MGEWDDPNWDGTPIKLSDWSIVCLGKKNWCIILAIGGDSTIHGQRVKGGIICHSWKKQNRKCETILEKEASGLPNLECLKRTRRQRVDKINWVLTNDESCGAKVWAAQWVHNHNHTHHVPLSDGLMLQKWRVVPMSESVALILFFSTSTSMDMA